MATAIQRLCLDIPNSCRKRNQFLSNFAPSRASNFVTFKSLTFSANLSQGIISNIKGSLSLSTCGRPIRHSVIYMAKRYAPNTTKRKRLSRKRAGDPDKKRRTRRKGGKRDFKIVTLCSAAGTGFFYAKKKSRKMTDKLELQKYDPLIKCHVLFTEVK